MLASALIILGLLAGLAGGVWFIVAAFRVRVWWGLGVIFVPFASLVFLVMHWPQAKHPALVSLAAGVLVGVLAVNQPGFMDAFRKSYAQSYAATQARLGVPVPTPPAPEAAANVPTGANARPAAPSDAQRAAALGVRYNQHVAELQTQCAQLRAERKTVHLGTAEESMYNAHLLSYNRGIVEAQEEKRQLDALNQQVAAATRRMGRAVVATGQ